jgi:hypothetical protein
MDLRRSGDGDVTVFCRVFYGDREDDQAAIEVAFINRTSAPVRLDGYESIGVGEFFYDEGNLIAGTQPRRLPKKLFVLSRGSSVYVPQGEWVLGGPDILPGQVSVRRFTDTRLRALGTPDEVAVNVDVSWESLAGEAAARRRETMFYFSPPGFQTCTPAEGCLDGSATPEKTSGGGNTGKEGEGSELGA